MTLADTDILIDMGRGIATAIDRIEEEERKHKVAISTITQMELLVGCRNKAEMRSLEQFLTRFELIRIESSIADMGVELLRKYRLSHGLLIPDALIAATALVLDYALLSKNQRDFRFIENLDLLVYP
ncbi:PIN domain protein [Candidatus Thiomargarita nelsonii]|uniref:Ribonuclease VapC n=1 Tax=Candidatus Thiomargarita nelsonii TaxID=1003181 RepID=A0A176RTT6_9GAMM|nr:PIN domain protein [Candidatus Thiomargarita nelsonii]